mmetsp:Transcript_16777/g.41300  ORF Transcript_16777/g.41300 Transcript_16777/m.41300 type:complete len:364 (-) Transcript_16777:262-1353(-)
MMKAPFILPFLLLNLPSVAMSAASTTSPSRRLALVAGFVDTSAIEAYLNTDWEFVEDDPLPASTTLDDVAVVIESDLAILDKTPAAELYQYAFTGYNYTDLDTIPPWFTIANVHQSAVAISEYVLSSMLNHVINIQEMERNFRNCTWKTGPPGNDCPSVPFHGQMNNLTVGIIGYGHIGEAIAVRSAAFGMTVIATTLNPPSTPPSPLEWIGDDSMNGKLCEQADFVVIACPLTPDTLGLFNETLLGSMKKTGVLINIARGPVVVEEALYNALKARAISGAVLDVWWNYHAWEKAGEYGPSSWPSSYRFDLLDNVVMTPHSSSYTTESRQTAAKEIAENLDALALGKPLQNVVRNATRIGPIE